MGNTHKLALPSRTPLRASRESTLLMPSPSFRARQHHNRTRSLPQPTCHPWAAFRGRSIGLRSPKTIYFVSTDDRNPLEIIAHEHTESSTALPLKSACTHCPMNLQGFVRQADCPKAQTSHSLLPAVHPRSFDIPSRSHSAHWTDIT